MTPPLEERQLKPVEPDEVRALLGPGGVLAEGLDGFERRDGQLAMALEVAEALNADLLVAAEAGTGIGKSFAYLIPAILWAVKNGERVIVSTGTIQLQEQLVAKDLPFLARVLPFEFRFALIKGRSNYACRRKVEELGEALAAPDWVSALGAATSEERELRDLVRWSREAGEGSRAELTWVPSDGAWEQVMSETDKSLKVKCKHYPVCFYYEARRAASAAQVLVVNHHLFFADLALRRQLEGQTAETVLPEYKRVIFDEAHHLEDVASQHLGVRISPQGIGLRLARMCSAGDEHRGAVRHLARALSAAGDRVAATAVENALVTAVREAQARVESSARRLGEALARAIDPAGRDRQGQAVLRLRYRHSGEERDFWEEVSGELQSVQQELGAVLKANDRAIEALAVARVGAERRAGLLLELTSFASRLLGVLSEIHTFLELEDRSQVRWLEGKLGRGGAGGLHLTCGAAPVRVGAVLKAALYDVAGTVVFTSATLSVAGQADFFAERLGLSGTGSRRFRFAQHPSPFDFQRQVLTAIPTDLPGPDEPGYEAAVAAATLEFVKASRGRAFVLFTSYDLLRRTYEELAPQLRRLDLSPMAQGEMARSILLERFKASLNGVLFGTDSFWEGVDVKGRALECVVITRLPFRVPTEPLQEARVEDLEERGVHPFMNFTLPQAVLKFKQGYGRLIRSSRDRGVAVVLDRRIVTKAYGQAFLRSLPATRVVRGPASALAGQAGEFLRRQDG